MLKRILVAMALLLGATTARAELADDYKLILLTENFPPFNMAADRKNYATENNVHGINADIVRELFKRAGIDYSLTLRFPWDRIYKQVLEQPNQGLFSTTFTPEREPLFKWVGPLASTGWVLLAPPGSPLRLSSLEQARQYRVGAYKNDAVSPWRARVSNRPTPCVTRRTSTSCSRARSISGPPPIPWGLTWPSRKASAAWPRCCASMTRSCSWR